MTKRSRDDVFLSSQLKGPAVPSPVEPSRLPQMSTASNAEKLTTNDALSYLKAVKEKCQDKGEKYNDFLDIMKDFKAQRIGTSGVILKVKELFKGHRDLILGFNAFLPKGHEITLQSEDEPLPKKKPVKFEEAMGFVNKIKIRFQGDDRVYKAFLGILNMYKQDTKSIAEVYKEVSVLFRDHADLLVEFNHFLPDLSGAAPVRYTQPGRNHILHQDDKRCSPPMTMTGPIHTENYINHPDSEEQEKREHRDSSEGEYDDSLDRKPKSARRDDSLNDQFHEGMQDPVSAFCEKVKERLQDSECYKKFLDCVRSFGSKFVTSPQFQKLAASLLGTHPDLMEECEAFITYVEKNGLLQNNKQISRSLKVEDHERDNHDKEDRDGNEGRNNGERDGHDRAFPFNSKDVPGPKLSAVKEKFMAKPIQELDLSNCERCTPSYRLLPENYPIPSVSRRTEIGDQVLNDQWVSVTSGSEDYSFKHLRRNQHEESLFRCEDDRFELDMLMESMSTTTKRVEELLDSMNAHTNKIDSSFRIEDHLTALNLRCIERLYGDHGLDVMEVLRKTAHLALPVILTRLTQKQEEWARCRSDFNKIWAEIYAKNFHRSLDHRSFHFKQQDTKNLSAKALLAEIKEMSEKNQNGDEMIMSIGAAYRQPIKPHMKFEYPDPDIQEDLYQLMKYSCGEVCTLEQCDKVMHIWTTFLEPLLGVPSRPPSVEDIEDIIMGNNCAAKSALSFAKATGSSVGEPSSENCKPSDVSNSEGEIIQTEKSCFSRVLMANGSYGIKDDGSLNADNVGRSTDISLSNAPQNVVVKTDNNMMSVMSGASKQAGFERVPKSAAQRKSSNEENGAEPQNGRDSPSSDAGMKLLSVKNPQDSATTKLTSSSIEDIKAQKYIGESECCTKSELEEGELSPHRNLEESNSAAFGNYDTKVVHNSFKSDESTRTRGETEASVDYGGEDSARALSDSENASENDDVSASESAGGDEYSPEDPDGDGHHKNDKKSERKGDCYDTEGNVTFSDHLLRTVKPLRMRTAMDLHVKEKNSEIFYGNDSFYLLFRLHQMLYERMQIAKSHSSSPENKWRNLNEANSTDSYTRFKDALRTLLNGSSDNAKFEDECRAIIGAQAYILLTLDKLIHKLIKQLQTIANEEMDNKLLQLYAYERSRNPGKFSDAVYHENARFLVPEDNLYRIECVPTPASLTIQLMKNEHDKPEATAVSMDPKFAAYLNGELLSAVPERKENSGIFLKRNKRKLSSRDEISDTCKAMEGLVAYNGLEIKVACNTLKAAYVLDTEDFLYRLSTRRKTVSCNVSCNGASHCYFQRVARFRRLVDSKAFLR